MYAQKLLVHDRSQWQGAEGIHTRVVYHLGVFVLAFEFESEIVREMATFVIASEQPKGVWVPDLERPQIQHALRVSAKYQRPVRRPYLNAEVSSVHVVSKKQVSCLRWVSSDLEQLHQVEVLAMNIAADCDGSIHFQQIWLGLQ
jgi:hypothetical protein